MPGLPRFPAEQVAEGRVAVTGHQARRGQLAEHVVNLGGHQLQERAQLGREQGPVTQESLVGGAGVAPEGTARSGVGLRSLPGMTAMACTLIAAPGTGSASIRIDVLGGTLESRFARTT